MLKPEFEWLKLVVVIPVGSYINTSDDDDDDDDDSICLYTCDVTDWLYML